MNKRIIPLLLLCASTMAQAQRQMTAPKGGKPISDELIGIFFEDISSSADGGLYAELLQNGSFEFSPAERDGWGPGTAWRTIRPGHSLGYIQPVTTPKVDKTFTSSYNSNTVMRLHVERAREFYDYKGWRGFGIQNDGFDGISVKNNAKYDFSMRLANVGGAKQVRVALVELQGWGKDPKLLSEAIIDIPAGTQSEPIEYKATLTPNADCQKAALQLLVLNEGDVYVDDVSLMPQDTYKGHGLRRTLHRH